MKLTYIEAKTLIDEFIILAEKKESIHFVCGFLESFAAQCLSGRTTDRSLKVLKQAIKDLS